MATHSLGTLLFWLVVAIALFAAFAALARWMAGMTTSSRRSHFAGSSGLGRDRRDEELGPDPSLRQIAEDEVARYRLMNEDRDMTVDEPRSDVEGEDFRRSA